MIRLLPVPFFFFIVRRHLHLIPLDSVLGLGTRAAAVCAVGVTGEFHHVGLLQSEDVLESLSDRLEDLLALRGCAGVLIALDALSDGACP